MIKLKRQLNFLPEGVEEPNDYLILRCSKNWRIHEFQSIVDEEVDYSNCLSSMLDD